MTDPRVFVIATKHPEFAEREFPKGSVVIDPWRYIPEQPGVTVRGLGRNRPVMISLLVPSRGRPREFNRMVESAFSLATFPNRMEVVVYLDMDDPEADLYRWQDSWITNGWSVDAVLGERIVLSEMWNRCLAQATGEIFMHCGDDIIFRTPGWDTIVRDTFDRIPDKIALVHGDDLFQPPDGLATHGFVHKRWVDVTGYLCPPLFSSDWNDVWLTEVADKIGRRILIPIVTEHLHYAAEKAPYDQTYREREERGARDGVVELYQQTWRERENDAAKLRAAMAS